MYPNIITELTSSPGRILGVCLFFATGIIWLYGEHKKKKEREAQKLEKLKQAESEEKK